MSACVSGQDALLAMFENCSGLRGHSGTLMAVSVRAAVNKYNRLQDLIHIPLRVWYRDTHT